MRRIASIPGELTFGDLLLAIYLPSFLFGIGNGAAVPFLPLFTRELGADLGTTGFIVSLSSIGVLFFDLPSGMLATRYGARRIMSVSAGMLVVLAALTGLSSGLFMLGVLIFLRGILSALWQLSRLTYLRHAVPISIRGRSLSLIGGIMRIGSFLGPIAGGYIAKFLDFRSIFFFQALLSLAAFTVFIIASKRLPAEQNGGTDVGLRGMGKLFLRERKTLATVGVGMIALSLLRTARSIIIPLWGSAIGLDVVQIGLVFGFGSAIDMIMFVPAGQVMDRLGRKWAALVATGGITLGFFLIPLTSGFGTFVAVSLLIGFTNGIGSGINMTIGSDLAPDDAPGQFFGLWHLINDVGATAGPLAVGWIAALMSLSASSVVVGILGTAGTILMALTMPETLERHGRD